jgi:hypothetical protein
MSSITEVAEGDMHAWVAKELYEELCQMPLWVQCAFGKKSETEGSEFVFEEKQYRLADYLIGKLMMNCPPWAYNEDYRHNWRMYMFIPLIRQAWVETSYQLATPPAETAAS